MSKEKLIPWQDYDGPLFCCHCDKLHENAEEWGDCQMESRPLVIPTREQALKEEEYILNAERILWKSAKKILKLCDQYKPRDITTSQPDDLLAKGQVESLQALLDAWKLSNRPLYYTEDEGVFVDFTGFVEARERRLNGEE